MSRESRREIVEENLDTFSCGYYNYNNVRKKLKLSLEKREQVDVFSPEIILEVEMANSENDCLYDTTNIIINDYNSFDAAYEAKNIGNSVVVLNSANAYIPGGGFLKGGNAQEEVLCRQSTLYQSISSRKARRMYDCNNSRMNSDTDSDYILVSRNVEVFRKASGIYLENSFEVSVISVPPPNLKMKAARLTREELSEERKRKLRKGFQVARYEGFDTIILGAWGCGAFGNDVNEVAQDMYEVLIKEEFISFFKNIIFAVYDVKLDNPNLNAFKSVFRISQYVRNGHNNREEIPNRSNVSDFNFSNVCSNIGRNIKILEALNADDEYDSEYNARKSPRKSNYRYNDKNKEILNTDDLESEVIKNRENLNRESLDTEIYKIDMRKDVIITDIEWPVVVYADNKIMPQDLGYVYGLIPDGRPFIAELYDESATDSISLNIIMSAFGFRFFDENESASDRFKNDVEMMMWKKSIFTKNLSVDYGGYGNRFEEYANEVLDYITKYSLVKFYDFGKRNVVCFMTTDYNNNKMIVCSILLKSGRSLKAKVDWDFSPFGALRNSLTAKYVVEMPEDKPAPTGFNASVLYKPKRR